MLRNGKQGEEKEWEEARSGFSWSVRLGPRGRVWLPTNELEWVLIGRSKFQDTEEPIGK